MEGFFVTANPGGSYTKIVVFESTSAARLFSRYARQHPDSTGFCWDNSRRLRKMQHVADRLSFGGIYDPRHFDLPAAGVP